ncbi:hypothetical protein ATHSA_1145 [Athalassotoga saccharophila]|nr:hypothetical protein ATHSA_1145 [Athalassotoga saccharophila]
MKKQDIEKVLYKEESKKLAEKVRTETIIKASLYGIRF